MYEENYKNLANAILALAYEDYEKALRHYKKYRTSYAKLDVLMLEDFFKSELGSSLTKLDTEEIAKEIRRKIL